MSILTATGCGRPDGAQAHGHDTAELLGCDAGELRARCYLPCQSVLCALVGGNTRLDIRAAQCLDRSHLIVGRRDTGIFCDTILGKCLRTSQPLPMREFLWDVRFEFVSLSKAFVSVCARDQLVPAPRHDGPCKEVIETHFPQYRRNLRSC